MNSSEDDVKCESFTVISIDSLLVYKNKDFLQVYFDNCAYQITNNQMTNYLDDNLFEDWILYMLEYNRIEITEGTDPTKSNRSKECI